MTIAERAVRRALERIGSLWIDIAMLEGEDRISESGGVEAPT